MWVEFSLSSGTFTGDPRTLKASNLSGLSEGVSVKLGFGPAVSGEISYAPSDFRQPFSGGILYRTVSAGAGLRVGEPTVFSFQENLNYTRNQVLNN